MRPFALSMGDPAGIGPEITAKAWQILRGSAEHTFAVIAPPSVFSDVPHQVITELSDANVIFSSALPVLSIDGKAAKAGQPSSDNAASIIASIRHAVTLSLSSQADGIVTNPIAKHVLYEAGFKFPGHTEFLGHLAEGHDAPYAAGPVMMLAAQDLRVGLATVHLSLKTAAAQLSTEIILRTARVMLGAFQCSTCRHIVSRRSEARL